MSLCTPTIERPDWALLLGGSARLWDDVDAVNALVGGPWPGLVIACNDAGLHWPGRLDHWVSLHWEKFFGPARDGSGDWIRRRLESGLPTDFALWTRKKQPDHSELLAEEQWGPGSSGYLMVPVARRNITAPNPAAILCGVPMDCSEHFDRPRPWTNFQRHRRAWWRDRPRLGWVRSMSRGQNGETSWTMKLLGVPDTEWMGAA